MKNKINRTIFKACDIRGVYNKELFDIDFYNIGKAFASILEKENKTTCVVGYDCRLSSKVLFENIKKGLIEGGITVYSFNDFVSTPYLYFALNKLKVDSALMITASHNPYIYNGCKFVMNDRIFHQDDIQNLANIIESDNYQITNKGSIQIVDLKDEYINYLISKLDINKLKDKTIVWDSANGATTFIIKDFVKYLPSKNILIFSEPDGYFSNHKPDPSKEENLELLKEEVLKQKADIGISFDGDGDRVGFVDEKGRYIDGNQLLILLSNDYLKHNPGEKIISEVKASITLYDTIKDLGGIPIMWKVGHTNQKSKMIEEDIKFGGETSGHIFYKENNYYDDGMFAAIKLLNYYVSTSLTLANLIDQISPIYNTGEIRLKMNEEERTLFLENIVTQLNYEKKEFIDIDGMRVEYKDGFWLLRKSNTEPHITLYCESNNPIGYNKILSNLKKYISNTNYELNEI
ncbi:MAG: phosphomannomutase/phosphoglucomutase [Pleomorphochaeta sp.]